MSSTWLIVSADFLTSGGQDRANYALASYLADTGHDVHLVAHRVAEELRHRPNVTVHAARMPLRSGFLGEPFLDRVARRVLPTLPSSRRVVVNGGNCDLPGAINWVHYVHAAYQRQPETDSLLRRMRLNIAHRRSLAGERRALARAATIIANSHRTRQDLARLLGINPSLISIVYYGIDPEQFRPATEQERQEIRRELGLHLTRPLVLFIGALGDRRKGFDVVFDAWTVLSRMPQWQAQLLVIGRGADMLAWEDRVQHAGLAGGIRFLGFRDDVPRIMRAADVLVSPTRYESYGLGVHEALCCGIPAIVSASAGVAERYPVELRDLLLPDPDDRADLARRMRDVIDQLDQLRERVSHFAGELRSRTWDDMAGEIVKVALSRRGVIEPGEVVRT